jgi:hypothetical protein
MAIFTGPVFVPNPVPIVDRYGLFAVATGPLTLPTIARGGGIQYETGTCVLPRGLEVDCGPADPAKVIESTPDVIVGTPFIVYSELTCGAVGLTQDRARMFLMERLKAGEQAVVENVFSTQAFGQSPGLSNNANVVTVTAVTEGITASVAALEEAFYSVYGLTGTLHVPHHLGARLQQGGALRWDNGRWRTAAGSLVSIGNYEGDQPDGSAAAAGTSWLYMTGQVTVWRTPDSEVFIPPYEASIDRATNQVSMVAEREYVIAFDCAVFGTAVTLNPIIV